MCLNNKRTNKGFTLLELMAVTMIISIGLVGVMNLINQISLNSRLTRSKLTAAYLAQEGIEVVRNIRDTNWVENASQWDNDISEGTFGLDYLTQALPTSGDPRCGYGNNFLKFDGDFFSCNGITATKFKRTVNIQKSGNEYISVLVKVTWQELQQNYEIRALEKLYRWR